MQRLKEACQSVYDLFMQNGRIDLTRWDFKKDTLMLLMIMMIMIVMIILCNITQCSVSVVDDQINYYLLNMFF